MLYEQFGIKFLLCQQFKVVFLLCQDLLPYMASVAWVHPKTANARFPFFSEIGCFVMSSVQSGVFVMSRFVTIYGKCGLGASKNGKCSFSDFSKIGPAVRRI